MIKDIPIDSKDLLWLAGLIDGDGCFHLFRKSKNCDTLRCSIAVKMTDKDIVNRVASLFGSSVVFNKSKNVNHQDSYTARIDGHRSISLMKLLRPYLSARRQNKIDEIVNSSIPVEKELKISASVEDLQILRKTKSCREIGLLYGVSGETVRMMTTGQYENAPIERFTCASSLLPQSHMLSLEWLSGLLEAEGSFMKGPPSMPNNSIISIQMSDKDIMENVASFFGTSLSSFKPKGRTKDNSRDFKMIYLCQLRGTRARKLMSDIKPLMGLRRQAQIQKALDSYNPNAKEDSDKKKMVIPDTALATVHEKRKSGLTLKKIASEYGVTRNVIRRSLERFSRLNGSACLS